MFFFHECGRYVGGVPRSSQKDWKLCILVGEATQKQPTRTLDEMLDRGGCPGQSKVAICAGKVSVILASLGRRHFSWCESCSTKG